jgi:putative transcriptional regulator
MPKRFEELIAQGEGISIEFKECKDALPKNVFETLCAFLNRFGGDIFLGLKDDGTIIGVDKDKSKKIRADFVSAMNNPQKIFPTVYLPVDEFELDSKTILHVYVPESSQVHNTNRRIFDRNEDGDFDITDNTDLVAAMYIRKQREYTENTVFPYATASDLKQELIDRARIMATNRNPHHPWERMTNEEILRSAGLYKKNLQTGESGYTLACILLFGTDEAILSALPHHKTDAIYRVKETDRYDDRDDIRCNLIESYDRLMAFIEKHVDDKFYMENEIRVSARNKLFREVVANMLIHREYSNAYPAKLIIEKDCVRTENGNKARGLGTISLTDFVPYPKNPVIASVFKEIGWAEELGSGVRNIVKYSKVYSGTIPEFIDGDVFKTKISLNGTVNGTVNDTVNGTVNDGVKLTPTEQAVLDCIRENNLINVAEIVDCTKKGRSTIMRTIKSLKEKGCIQRVGSDKTGSWEILR